MKFGLISKAEVLKILRILVYDFRGHNIDMTCAILEAGGLYLYRQERRQTVQWHFRSADSHVKTKVLLDVIQKKKQRIKDTRHLVKKYVVCSCADPH